MAYSGKMVARFENSNVSSANYALIDFDFRSTDLSMEQLGALVITYCEVMGGRGILGDDTILQGVQQRAIGTAGFLPLPYPVTQASTAMADYNTEFSTALTSAGAYGVTLGAGVLAPLGTSVSVSEITGHAGRTGRGRHFLPYVSAGAVDSSGQLLSAGRTYVEQAYNFLILDNTTFSGAPIPVVTGTWDGTGHEIIACKAQPVFSNLESRRR